LIWACKRKKQASITGCTYVGRAWATRTKGWHNQWVCAHHLVLVTPTYDYELASVCAYHHRHTWRKIKERLIYGFTQNATGLSIDKV
jgi:hypothetical protein